MIRQAWFPALLLLLLGLMIWSTELATLAAGVSLFVLGIGRLEEGFRAFSGGALERWLNWSTDGLGKSLLVGVVSTALVQSSTLVTLLGIAFLSAGLINTLGGVGLVFGANLGTTSGAWLIALAGLKLNMAQLSMPMLAMGVFLARRSETGWRGGGLALLGIGLLFLGIDLMKTGFSGFEGAFDLARYTVEGWAGVLLFVLIGALATVIMQSSHATLVLTLAALAAGQVHYDNALALVIGANLGSTATALFAAIGSNNAGRRIAATHLIFNLVTAGAALLLLHQLMAVVEWLADVGGVAPDAHMLKLAIFHTLYNVFGLVLMLPWSFLLVRLLERWLPDTGPETMAGRLGGQARARALYVNESALLHADTALRVLEQELQHLAGLSRQVVAAAVYLPDELADMTPAALHQAVRQPVPMALREDAEALYERHIKGVYADIVEFMSRLDVSLLPGQQQAMLNLSMAARDLVTAVKAAKHLQSNLRRHIDSSQPTLREAYQRLREQCGLTLLELRDWPGSAAGQERVEQLESSEARAQLFMDGFQQALQQHLRNRELDGWQATSLLNGLHYMQRIHRHLLRAHAALGHQVPVEGEQGLDEVVSLA